MIDKSVPFPYHDASALMCCVSVRLVKLKQQNSDGILPIRKKTDIKSIDLTVPHHKRPHSRYTSGNKHVVVN